MDSKEPCGDCIACEHARECQNTPSHDAQRALDMVETLEKRLAFGQGFIPLSQWELDEIKQALRQMMER